MNLPTYEEIKPFIEKKLVSAQPHPQNPDVMIFNYTQHCQFSGEWNDITRQCRGLILNVRTGEVLARPFAKFFNYGEHIAKGWDIPQEEPVISEKMDGSLGILYHLDGKPMIATRGSFTSDQATWATRWWNENVPHIEDDGMTHLFEIIYPQNRIVVNYDFSGLVHIASIERKTYLGEPGIVFNEALIKRVKDIPNTALEKLAEMDESNSEGFVLFYPKANVRMKIKFPEYVRLHKLVTGVNEIAVWEHLQDAKSFNELIEKVPDEFFKWVKSVATRLIEQFKEIDGQCFKDMIALDLTVGDGTRKEKALFIQKNCKYPAVMFAKLDEKPREPIIWKMVRPRGQSTFKVDIDV